jgi:hypothetical protein
MGSGGGGGAACTPSHSVPGCGGGAACTPSHSVPGCGGGAACTPSHSVPGRRGPRTRARRATRCACGCSSLRLLRGCAQEALPALRVARCLGAEEALPALRVARQHALRVARGLGSLHGRGPHGRRSEHRRPRCAGGGRWTSKRGVSEATLPWQVSVASVGWAGQQRAVCGWRLARAAEGEGRGHGRDGPRGVRVAAASWAWRCCAVCGWRLRRSWAAAWVCQRRRSYSIPL